jgi:cell division protein FtsQ
MWDRPELLSRIANLLFALAGLLVAYGLVWFVVHQPVFALRAIEITGEARYVTRAQVEAIAKNEVKGTFFTLNLPHLRRAFEKLPWVREVKLRRRWPDRLEVSVVEHVPLARWGNAALVNTQGEVFHAAYDGKLPVFVGPPGTAKEIAIQYEFFRRHLAAIGAKPVTVQVTARRAWRVRLEGGQTLILGRQDVEARLARYIGAHERTVGTLERSIEYVDLRYANGFAVRIPGLKGEALPGAAQRKALKRTVAPEAADNKERREALRGAFAPEGAATGKSAERRLSAQLRPKRSEGAA